MVSVNEAVYLAFSAAAALAMGYGVFLALNAKNVLSQFISGELMQRVNTFTYILIFLLVGYIITPIAMLTLEALRDYVFIIAAFSLLLIGLSYILNIRILMPLISLGGKSVIGIKWSEALATGVEEIDNQHKEIFSRLEALFDAAIEKRGKEETAKVIEFLADYVVTHFGTEEKYMTKHNYPDYQAHKAEHERFLGDFPNFKKQFDVRGSEHKVIGTVVNWLINHIDNFDRAMAAFLRTRA